MSEFAPLGSSQAGTKYIGRISTVDESSAMAPNEA